MTDFERECYRCGLCCLDCGDLAYGEGAETGRCPALRFEGVIAVCGVEQDNSRLEKPQVCQDYPFADCDGGRCTRQLKGEELQ